MGIKIRRKYLVYTSICIIIVLSVYPSNALDKYLKLDLKIINNPNNIYEWADGEFTGNWISNLDEEEQGEIKGYIKQGRNPYLGTIIGEWSENNSCKGFIKAFYRYNFILGWINSSIDKYSLFFGKIIFNDSNFQGKIMHKTGFLLVEGIHRDSFLPMLTGDFNVGIKNLHLIDEERYELFTPDNPNDYREMIAQIWYPVDKNIINDRIDYMDDLTFQWLFERSPVPLITIPKNAYEYVRPYSYNEAPIASEPENFPVILFSHGYDGVYQIYTSLIEDLVSNGFVVVSINHPYIAGIVVFPDGEIVRVADISSNISLQTVVDDIKFVLDQITEINKSDSFLNGKFDLSRVGVYGHSFGGAATAICCYEDSRFKAGLTLDGYFSEELLSEKIPENFDKPFLMMVAEGRLSDPGSNYIFNLLNRYVYKVEVIGSTHYGFTDIGILLDHFVPLIPSEPLGFGTINPKRLVNITKSYEIAFFEVFLKNAPINELINLSSNFDEVIFIEK